MTTPFSPTLQQQQIFVLSLLSNEAGKCTWTSQTLQDNLNICTTTTASTPSPFGTWNLVYGPYYYSNSGLQPGTSANANTVYVAQQAQSNVYVIAIAGTNKNSGFDWATEDLDINPIPWPYAPTAGYVTQGDADGTGIILGTSYPPVTPPSTSGLLTFLQSLPNKSEISLTITGHSLGGALAPLVALALFDPQSTINTTAGATPVDASQWQQIYVMATAGPSPADESLVQYLNQTVSNANQSNPSQWRNDFIWNELDIVPHVWDASTFQNISTLYSNTTLPAGCCIATKIQDLQSELQQLQQQYKQFQPNPSFSGGLQSYALGFENGETEYVAQVIYQHVLAYIILFGASWLTQAHLESICSEPLGDLCNEPLIAYFVRKRIDSMLCP